MLLHLLGISSLAAVGFHLTTLRHELDFYLFHLIGLYIAALVGIAWSLSQTTSVLLAILDTAVIAVSFNTALATSILTHRVFLHRLGKFPGPLVARISKFWMVKKVWGNSQGYIVIDKTHQKYGDFIRIGPRELSINPPTPCKSSMPPHPAALNLPSMAQLGLTTTSASSQFGIRNSMRTAGLPGTELSMVQRSYHIAINCSAYIATPRSA
ncbi:hypothetical protein K440DRAFT_643236 [Wilcoxina mikolae CBS 423.85]|nr:hypothetical protein K440DRAFT_643236 [Wilcoxina mikolae CBS 423.85]